MEPDVAAAWVQRWDAQQEHYAHRRQERFTTVVDLVRRATADQRDPVVLDLGAGPGSLAARVAEVLPGSRVLAFECDPVLVAIGRSWCGQRVEFVDQVVGAPGWSSTVPRPVAAVISSTALHYPSRQQLGGIYADVHALLRPGGLMANADHFGAPDLPVRETSPDHLEPWHSWWSSAAAAPELAEAFDLRRSMPSVDGDNGLSLREHVEELTAAGFIDADAVWRDRHTAVLAAWRPR